ncbi:MULTISPECIES: SdpI family protein [Brevundimonas]|uniref:SdpI family protein n=1 Tax=Brevundimonas TaxID=41275 RepID=UPI000E670DC0|nr:SdpI family protein [Brevundimonas sp. LPMIX5]RIJ66341.1 DUF1648 domain-containing protein [Brevundimonas sp. LPMIX5]
MTRVKLDALDLASIILIGAVASLAIWVGTAGPTTPIPIHFNLAGEADGWAPRGQVAWMIGGLGVAAAATVGGCSLYARLAQADPARRRSLKSAQLVSLLAFAGCIGLIAFPLFSKAPPSQGAHMAVTALLLLAVGAFLGRVGPNVAVGVRTPWNYKSKLAWERSNRLAGRLMFGLGLVGLIAAPIAPQPLGFSALITGALIAAAWSVFESWRVWRADPDRQPF